MFKNQRKKKKPISLVISKAREKEREMVMVALIITFGNVCSNPKFLSLSLVGSLFVSLNIFLPLLKIQDQTFFKQHCQT